MPWGKGPWPAVWMLPADDRYGGWAVSGEIDPMEIVGEEPHEVLNSLHFGASCPHRSLITTTHRLPGGSTVQDWRTCAVEWEPGEIRIDVDEVQACTCRHWCSCRRRRKRALPYRQTMLARVRQAAPGKPVPISEAGWPDEGSAFHGAVPGHEAAIQRFVDTAAWAEAEGVAWFHFAAFDEAWKVGTEGDVGAFRGLWDQDARPRFG